MYKSRIMKTFIAVLSLALFIGCKDDPKETDPFASIQMPAVPIQEGMIVNADFPPYSLKAINTTWVKNGVPDGMLLIASNQFDLPEGDLKYGLQLFGEPVTSIRQSIGRVHGFSPDKLTMFKGGAWNPVFEASTPYNVSLFAVDTTSTGHVTGQFQATVQLRSGAQGHIKGAFNAVR